MKVFILGVDSGKEIVVSRLSTVDEGPGYCHFPILAPFSCNLFQLLLSFPEYPNPGARFQLLPGQQLKTWKNKLNRWKRTAGKIRLSVFFRVTFKAVKAQDFNCCRIVDTKIQRFIPCSGFLFPLYNRAAVLDFCYPLFAVQARRGVEL